MTDIPAVRKVILLRQMIAADRKHLMTAIDEHDLTEAHLCVDSIIRQERELEDLIGGQ